MSKTVAEYWRSLNTSYTGGDEYTSCGTCLYQIGNTLRWRENVVSGPGKLSCSVVGGAFDDSIGLNEGNSDEG